MVSLKASEPTKCASTVISRFTGHPSVLIKVLALERRTFSKADSWAGILDKEVKRRNTVLLYASFPAEQDKIAGYIIFTTNHLTVHISKVAVDKACRRRGIATQLVKECLMLSKKERKVLCATLHVDPQNTGAYKLYAGLGFSIDGVLQDYYSPEPSLGSLGKDTEVGSPMCRDPFGSPAARFSLPCVLVTAPTPAGPSQSVNGAFLGCTASLGPHVAFAGCCARAAAVEMGLEFAGNKDSAN